MRVLHLIYDHPKNPWVGGGGAVRVYELGKRLAQKGHEVTVLSGSYPGAADYTEGGLSYKFIGPDKNYMTSTFGFAVAGALYILRHSASYDIVVEDFAPWNPVFAWLLTRRPAVLHLNHKEGRGILSRKGFFTGLPFYLIEALYPKLYRHVTALSDGTQKKISQPDVVVVPAGISAETIVSEPAAEDDFLLYVGRLHISNKGLDTLIGAMRMLGPSIRLILAGRGPDEHRLREISDGLNVEFRGFVTELEKLDLMRRARVFVLPSRFEGWGIVVLEAGACGRPVIVSDIPELDFAVQGGFGIAFRTGDEADLASKLALLLGSADTRRQMGERAISYVRQYTWESIADDYEALLMRMISEGR